MIPALLAILSLSQPIGEDPRIRAIDDSIRQGVQRAEAAAAQSLVEVEALERLVELWPALKTDPDRHGVELAQAYMAAAAVRRPDR